MKDVVKTYTDLTGKPALPPTWSFGLWLTTSFTTNYDEATVNHFIEGMAERHIPLHVFHYDCFWMQEFRWCDFTFDERMFPKPQEMLKRLKDKGLKICLWINPYIAQKSILFKEGKEQGYFLKRLNGDVWQWDLWQAGMACVDFTNPEANSWYQKKLQNLIDMGVDCFKTDFGERIPTEVVYHNGADPTRMHNYYAHLYNKVVFELLEKNYGKDQAAVFARSGTAGGQQFPVHWGGDCMGTYESMAETLRGGLSLSMSGYAFWSHDISGFENTASPDLYKRWCAFGLLSTHSRLHGSSSYRVPWNFDEEASDVLKFFTNLKCQLMPYIFSAACKARENGIPVMRTMIMEFQEDKVCPYLETQYAFGDGLIVAPIFSESGIVEFYLPKGKFTNIIDGEVFSGTQWCQRAYDYFNLGLLAKENTIIPMGQSVSEVDYNYLDEITYCIYEMTEGAKFSFDVYNENAELAEIVIAENIGNQVIVKVTQSEYNWNVRIKDKVHHVKKGLYSIVIDL